MTLLYMFLLLLALPAVAASAYLLTATLLSGALPPATRSSRKLRFDIVVPAHDEATVIERAVTSLRRLDWPAGKFRILVVADNCADATAALARNAGATVIERRDLSNRGKGYALDFAFNKSLKDAIADAVVVVDADSEVSDNLLEAFAARIENGAVAVQAHYGVLNPLASWRTRLITMAKASFHIVRSRARERLGLSCGIRGNGWCVTHALLRELPFCAYSITEDLEYGITLGLAGYRVHYADEAHAKGEMVSGGVAAGKQRQRWEGGRMQLIRTRTLPLLRAALYRRSKVCLDLALDLLVLPLSYVSMNIAALIVCSGIAMWWQPEARILLWIGVICAASLLLYVLRGWRLSGLGRQGLFDLMYAPFFVLWKIPVMLGRRESAGWVSTERERA
ncbi:glycosyltransferase family 2 protein [Nevskia soli]|uniref:glycosyltransferase family 2 protein n=1 Tax=Nevskia soli TaxID=418856 RepID=UPI0004A6FE47|nr:glycosyltransferase family 2 protein [Nevskia soli]